MNEMVPKSDDQSEMESVQVMEPLEPQADHQCVEVKTRSRVLAFLRRNAFVLLTVAAVAIGLGLGFALRNVNLTKRDIRYLKFPGELLFRVLRMLILPLILSSLISGLSCVDSRAYGKIGLRALAYYMLTTVVAGFTGILLAVSIQPGKRSRDNSAPPGGGEQAVQSTDAFLDLIRNLIPSNLVEACFRKFRTIYSRSVPAGINVTETGETEPIPGFSDGMNMLGLLFFSLAFGLTLGSMGTRGKPLRDFFVCLHQAIMHLVNIFIWYSPVGIIFLLAGQVLKMVDIGEMGRDIGMYMLSVMAGLAVHAFITLPLIYFVFTRTNPFRFMSSLLQPLTTAFGTSSSSATLPVTLRCMEEIHNMDQRVTRFMLPAGATMNMDGSALYETLAALFVAQLNDIDFNVGQMIVLCLIATAASSGASGTPSAGMVTMTLVLTSVGLPTEDISLLLTVDWMLDRFRTMVNVLGDCVGAVVVQHLSRHELKKNRPADVGAQTTTFEFDSIHQ